MMVFDELAVDAGDIDLADMATRPRARAQALRDAEHAFEGIGTLQRTPWLVGQPAQCIGQTLRGSGGDPAKGVEIGLEAEPLGEAIDVGNAHGDRPAQRSGAAEMQLLPFDAVAAGPLVLDQRAQMRIQGRRLFQQQ